MKRFGDYSSFLSTVFLCSMILLSIVFIAGKNIQAEILVSGDIYPIVAPSTWDYSTVAYIGNGADGSLSLSSGSSLTTGAAHLGYGAMADGLVTIDGLNTVWNNNDNLNIGSYGTGTLNITNGGTVSGGHGSIGSHNGATGVVSVNGVGSTWFSSGNIQVGQDYATGTLNITNGGTVRDDYGFIGSASGATGSVIVDGAGSSWFNSRLSVGMGLGSGIGTLTITNGGKVWATAGACMGGVYGTDSSGTVTVDGTGSSWATYSASIFGLGTLNITNGATVTDVFANIGSDFTHPSSIGVVNVDGIGSTWTNISDIRVGDCSTGILNITKGGTVTNAYATVGCDFSGTVTVDGVGSKWTNSNELQLGAMSHQGQVHITNGGFVSAPEAYITPSSMLTIDLGRNSGLSMASGPGTITNMGTIRLLAGAETPSGEYIPIEANNWQETGIVQALGGIWDTPTHTVTVSDAVHVKSGQETTIDLSKKQRIFFADDSSGTSIETAFLGTNTPHSLTFTASIIDDTARKALQELLTLEDTLISGWDFYFDDGYAEGDPVYLSFFVGPDLNLFDLNFWHYNDKDLTWSRYTASDLSYDGCYANFTVTDFSGYAITGNDKSDNAPVPEPSTLLLLGCGIIGLTNVARKRCENLNKW